MPAEELPKLIAPVDELILKLLDEQLKVPPVVPVNETLAVPDSQNGLPV